MVVRLLILRDDACSGCHHSRLMGLLSGIVRREVDGIVLASERRQGLGRRVLDRFKGRPPVEAVDGVVLGIGEQALLSRHHR